MKVHLLSALALISITCFAAQPAELRSPSGRLSVRADLPRSDETLFVRLVFTHLASKKEWVTYAESSVEWAIAWTERDVLVLVTSLKGGRSRIFAWHTDGSHEERAANEAEKEIGRLTYEKKYPKKTNQ